LPDVIIPRLIGITSIIALILAVGFFSSNITMQMTKTTSISSLKDVTEQVSSEIIDLVSLASLTPDSNSTYKVLEIPDQVNNKGYSVYLQNDSLGWKVVAYLDEDISIRAESNLYFKGGVNVENGTGIFHVIYNWQDVELFYSTRLYSGTYKPVVWCNITQSNIMVGLGWLGVTG